MKAFLNLVEHESALSYLRNNENKERRARNRYFSPSSRLQALDKEMILARKVGPRQRFLSFRKRYCELLPSQRRAFQLYKVQVSRQPETREFCRLLDRLRPQKAWRVNVGDHREDPVTVKLLKIQGERLSSTRFKQTQLLCLACADVENRHNQEPCFDMHGLNAALLTCSLRKSPGSQWSPLRTLTSPSPQGFSSLDCIPQPRIPSP